MPHEHGPVAAADESSGNPGMEAAGAGAAGADLTVVIPAFNEAGGIGTTLDGLLAELPQAEIIVIDDGSWDGTAEAAHAVPGVHVIGHGFNRGYGAALKTGMMAATRPLIAWFDADNEHRVSDLIAMKDLLVKENAAAVIGRRRQAGVTLFRAVGKTVIRGVARLLGLKVGRDLNCGLRVFRRFAILPYLSILPDTYSASTTSTMVMAERRYPVRFFDIDTNPRIGQSKVQLRHGFVALTIILRTITLFAPLRIFFGLGMTLIVLGIAYSVVVALLRQQGIPTAGVLSVLSGLLLCSVGLIADQISQMRLLQLSQQSAELSSQAISEELTQDES